MKIGEYVRTEYGISKIIGIYPEKTMIFIETDNGLGNCSSTQNGELRKGIVVLEEDYRNFIDNNVKEKLIDLIQVGDYVNGMEVIDITPYYGLVLNEIDYNVKNGLRNYHINNEQDIKSIVTKEQFESMEYKLGE